jgi:hypothetical protein
MNNLLYIDKDPTKPLMYIGVIFFSYNTDKKTHFLLMENNLAKYSDIGINIENYIDESQNDNNIDIDTDTNDIINKYIINALKFHSNYLIDITVDEIGLLESRKIYIPSEMALIKFIKAPEIISKLKPNDFGSFTVKTNEEKIRRNIKWIDKTYLFRFLFRFKKISKRLNNKEILDTFRIIDSENNLNQVLNNIYKKIKSSSN